MTLGSGELARLERWMQAVITHPSGVLAGASGSEARAALDVNIGDVVLPCRQVCIPEGSEVNIPDLKSDFDDDSPTFGCSPSLWESSVIQRW